MFRFFVLETPLAAWTVSAIVSKQRSQLYLCFVKCIKLLLFDIKNIKLLKRQGALRHPEKRRLSGQWGKRRQRRVSVVQWPHSEQYHVSVQHTHTHTHTHTDTDFVCVIEGLLLRQQRTSTISHDALPVSQDSLHCEGSRLRLNKLLYMMQLRQTCGPSSRHGHGAQCRHKCFHCPTKPTPLHSEYRKIDLKKGYLNM